MYVMCNSKSSKCKMLALWTHHKGCPSNRICGPINLRIPECLNVCLNGGSGDEMASGECPIHNIIRNLSWGHQCDLALGPGASENGLGWVSRRP